MSPELLLERLDALRDHVADIKVTLAAQAASLDEHMRRTEAAEASLEKLHAEVIPLKQHVAMWAGAGKVLAILGTLATIGALVMKALGK